MMEAVIEPCARGAASRRSRPRSTAVNCHHNYVAREHHFGADVLVTRKGAVRARRGRARHHPRLDGRAELHRARQGQPGQLRVAAATAPGRAMSRGEAKRRFTLADHVAATAGVECRKDADVIDETPMAYKDDRRGDGGAGGPGRDRAHAAPGRVREGERPSKNAACGILLGLSDRAGARSSRTLG